jgi:hypothetical protein
LSFSPGDPPIFSRVAGDRFMLQPGSCCRNHWISGLQTTSTNITQGVATAPTAAIEHGQGWLFASEVYERRTLSSFTLRPALGVREVGGKRRHV